MFSPHFALRRPAQLSRSISTLLPLLALAGLAIEEGRAETWTVGNSSTGVWSNAANWTSAAGSGDVPEHAPPGVAGGIYNGIRLNINGPMAYTPIEGIQTYDVSAAGGENRALGIGMVSNAVGTLTLSGGEMILVQEGANTVAFLGNGNSATSGTLNLDGGKLTINEIDTNADATLTVGFGSGATAVVNIYAGGVLTTDRVRFSEGGTAFGTLNLEAGGELVVRNIFETNAAGTSTLNFNGGTIRLRGETTSALIAGTIDAANILAGGLTVNTNGFSGNIEKALTDGGGGGGLTKTGAGTLVLSGDGTYTGATTVSEGTLQLGNNGTTGSIGSASTLNLAAGTTLAISRSDALTQSTFTGAGTAFQGGLAGDVNFTKSGSGIFTADVANTHTGITTVTGAGVLLVKNAQAFGSTTGATTVGPSAAVALSNLTVTGETITLNFDGGTATGGEIVNPNRGALQGSSGSSVWAGNVTLGSSNARIGIQEGANITVTGNITDGGAGHTMIFRGGNAPGGFVTISGTGNQWGRTEVYGYTVRTGAANALPAGAVLAVGIDSGVIPQSILDLNGFNQTAAGLTQVGSNATGVVTNNGATDVALTLDGSVNQTYFGTIADGTTHKVSLVKDGSFAQTLVADQSYTGATTLNAGTLQLGNGGTTGSLAGPLIMNAGTLGISRSDMLTQSTFTGGGITGGITGGIGFAKGGSNIFTLDVANSHTGPTSVAAGVLRLTNALALGSTAGENSVAPGSSLALAGVTITGENVTISGLGLTTTVGGTEFAAVQRGALQGSAGANTWTGDVLVAGTNTRIGVQDGASLTISGTITDGGAGHTVIFRGGTSSEGLITLSGTGNSWGRTDIYGSGVRLGVDDALATQAPAFVGTTGVGLSRLDLNGFDQTVAGLSQIENTSSADSLVTNLGDSDSVLTLDGATDLSYVGRITDGTTHKVALVKNGSFTQRLSGASTYTGPTTVNAGALLVNGSLSGTTVAVNGGVLGGNGQVTGAVNIGGGGSLLGGDGVTATQDFAVNGDLTLGDGSTIRLTLGAAGAHSSLLRLGGTWSFDLNQSFSFIDAGAETLVYDNILSGLAADPGTAAWTIANAGWSGTFAYDGAGGVDLTLSAVPEPSGALLFLTGGALLGFRRRARTRVA